LTGDSYIIYRRIQFFDWRFRYYFTEEYNFLTDDLDIILQNCQILFYGTLYRLMEALKYYFMERYIV